MSLKIKIIFPILIAFSVFAFFLWKQTLPLVSPIALIETLIGNSPSLKSPKTIYGFFPYWNLSQKDTLNINNLTHFAYFALDLNSDGSIHKKTNSKEAEPGWHKLNNSHTKKLLYQSKLLGQKTVLTITAMELSKIESILTNEDNLNRAVQSIMTIYHDFDFDDINLDFEYVQKAPVSLQNQFTKLTKFVKNACRDKKPHCQVDVSVFGSVAETQRLWNLRDLDPYTDKFIIMAYDYHRKSSPKAGPIAPIKGKCTSAFSDEINCLEEDIITHLSQITKLIPSHKVILGIPFYGYEWQVASTDFLVNTYKGTGALATYQRITKLLHSPSPNEQITKHFSSLSLSPYLVITSSKSSEIRQIHYEDAQSLTQKIRLVNDANLGGIAIWALGYEGQTDDLWQAITSEILL